MAMGPDLQQASPIPLNIPRGIVTEWTVEDVRNWLLQSMQLPQYLEQFQENEIAGDVLVHLDHDALKDLEVHSVGHRLYLLKQIYNLKVAHGIKFEKDDYVPITAPKGDEETEALPPNILKTLRDRDSKIQILEYEVKRMTDQLYRLKEELAPVFKFIKEKPLPTPATPELPAPMTVYPPPNQASSLARKFSKKALFLTGSRKTADSNEQRQMEISKPLMSPTYLNGSSTALDRPESPRSPTKTIIPITPGLIPPTPSSHGGYTPVSEVQGTSVSSTSGSYAYTPNSSYGTSPVTPRRERNEGPAEEPSTTPRKRSNSADREAEKEKECSRVDSKTESRQRTRERDKDKVSNPMKQFRVNLDDPCWKVLPVAMKKYEVKGKEEDYRLYITYGDVERKLTANEKPLLIFQQLQKEGRNPLFMLRYAGKSRSESERERDREERDHRNGSSRATAQNKEEDPISPKSVFVNGSDAYR